MKKINIALITHIILLISSLCACTPEPVQKGIHTSARLKQLFADPPSEYRSAPFWVWNEQISEEGIDFQLREFKKAGIGGVFVHPRPGLLTEYLSAEWFSLFDFAVQKGKELDMKVWIYDENSYPSGFAGGHVQAEMPDSYKHGAGLRMEVQQVLNISLSDTVAVVLKKTAGGFEDITETAEQEKGKEGTYYIFSKTYPGKSPWYGGFSYVDLLYKGVTGKFLDITMTRGYEKSSADFGSTIQGIFTDEPNLEAALSAGAVMRWTPDLWDRFKEHRGYDLKVNLPSLVEETGNWKKVRHDYYELLLELFIDRWVKPWSKYCEENNLIWTGHYWEHGWPEPTDGLDELAFYIWHQMPGVDMLGFRLDTTGLGGQFGNDRAIRELLSAANQAGWNRTLSETYGGGGWNMTFEEQKRLADWQFALGVNFVNLCLSFYSLNGVRKFDYPLSFTYHEPWWEYYRLMGDYIGRVSMAMSSGEQINKTLVLQPNTTAWMYFSRKNKNPRISSIRDGFKSFIYRLEQQHLEYDLGSENVLKVLGSVNGKKLLVGKRDYSLVVIPAEMENIDQTTYDLLDVYLRKGGKVLAFTNNVPFLDGEPSSLVNELMTGAGENWVVAGNLNDPKALNMLKNGTFTISDETRNGMFYHQRRILDDGQLLFVANSHPREKTSAEIIAEGRYVSLLDPETGRIYNYPVRSENGKVSFRINLEPAGSALFAISVKKNNDPEYLLAPGGETVLESAGAVSAERVSDNVLVVNYLDLKTVNSEKKNIYFMNANISLFTENGVAMGNPWQHKIQYKRNYLDMDTLFSEGSGFEASYHFYIDENLSADAVISIRAVVERPELWTVSINGTDVPKTDGSYWIDKDFPEYRVGQFLRYGKNTLILKAPRMNILAEIMPVYLIGDFLVKPSVNGFEITGGKFSSAGSWKDVGMPFYSHKVDYSQTFKVKKTQKACYKVKLGQWSGTIAEVVANGQSAGLIAWKPYELDVTSLVKDGDNNIVVRVTGSLRNTFGPFHDNSDDWIIGPHSWLNAPGELPSASGYFLLDYGLMEPFSLVEFR